MGTHEAAEQAAEQEQGQVGTEEEEQAPLGPEAEQHLGGDSSGTPVADRLEPNPQEQRGTCSRYGTGDGNMQAIPGFEGIPWPIGWGRGLSGTPVYDDKCGSMWHQTKP